MKQILNNFYTPYLIKILSVIIAILAPIQSVILSVFTLILFDFISGMYASYKNNIKITSFKMRNTLIKILFYNMAVITALIIEKLLWDGLPVIKVVGGIIAAVEGKSKYENITLITGTDFLTKMKSLFGTDTKIN